MEATPLPPLPSLRHPEESHSSQGERCSSGTTTTPHLVRREEGGGGMLMLCMVMLTYGCEGEVRTMARGAGVEGDLVVPAQPLSPGQPLPDHTPGPAQLLSSRMRPTRRRTYTTLFVLLFYDKTKGNFFLYF